MKFTLHSKMLIQASASVTNFLCCLLLVAGTAGLQAQQLPFQGSPMAIPGIIQAEDFDLGGMNVAYYDSDEGNTGTAYRDTDVDIEPCSQGDYNVGWIVPGEWLEYTIDVAYTSVFILNFQVASGASGGVLHVELDGSTISDEVLVPSTGGWQSWTSAALSEFPMEAGQHVLRLVFDAGAYNVDQIECLDAIIPDPPTIEITYPADNTDFYFGEDILIQAEATDSNGTVELVEFFADEIKIGEDALAPYEWLWEQPAMGNWDLTAIATDNDGARTRSGKIDVSVRFPQYEHEVQFSVTTAFHQAAFPLELHTELENAEIWYTLDGSDPWQNPAHLSGSSPLSIWIDPQSTLGGRGTTSGVVVRAVLVSGGLQASRVATQTFLFLNAVPEQGYPGGNWPDYNVNNQILDYSVDQGVASDPEYAAQIDDALLDIPSISIVTHIDSLFGAEEGIYVNAQFHGRAWERGVSVELLNPDGSPGFQIDAGLRIRGGWSRHPEFPKHAFRLFFREVYGDNRLVFPLFGDEGVDEFKKLDLRTSQNYAWSNGHVMENTMNRDVFSRDLQRGMNQPYTRSRYYHLYLNGLYWGLYQSQERPEANFAESYLGGNDNDYDVVKVDIGEDWNLYEIEATDGNLETWQEVWTACENGFSSLTAYRALEGRLPDGSVDPQGRNLVDIDNLIDYMIIIFYTGNIDAPVSKFRGNQQPNNFYAIKNRNENEGFVFLTHDSEHTLLVDPIGPSQGLNEDRVNINPWVGQFRYFHPQWLHYRLAENPEYRMRFADRVYRHLFNDGTMTEESMAQIFSSSAGQIDLAIIGESLRWGDLSRSKYNAWEPAIEHILNDFFPYRSDIFMDQLRQANLYPELEPPSYALDGTTVSASQIQIGGAPTLSIVNPEPGTGTIFFTLDGSDPRGFGGAISGTAQSGGNSINITLTATQDIKARLYNAGSWSALHELRVISPDDLSPLRVTELHYHPLDEGEISGKEYEFLELHNSGNYTLNLSFIRFTKGIDFTFQSGTELQPDASLVLASNHEHFIERYGFEPFDVFVGQLDNSGERLVLENAAGDTLINLRYNDEPPWPLEADGEGPSLVWTNEMQTGDLNDGLNWSASSQVHGTPGIVLPTAISAEMGIIPAALTLSGNYPNPFNPSTTIRYALPHQADIQFIIYDMKGRRVFDRESSSRSAGWHSFVWDGTTTAGEMVSAGVYICQIRCGDETRALKMLFLK